jgi:hypothetical protein
VLGVGCGVLGARLKVKGKRVKGEGLRNGKCKMPKPKSSAILHFPLQIQRAKAQL